MGSGIVLCGGRSERMGRSKAALPLGSSTMLERVIRALGAVVEPIVLVAALGQSIVEPGRAVEIIRDRSEFPGPLEALILGLQSLASRSRFAFVTGCDFPLMRPAVIHELCRRLADHDLVMLREGQRLHPLVAVYRTSLADRLAQRAARGRRDLVGLASEFNSLVVDAEELRNVDPDLRSLCNVNTPEEYQHVLNLLSAGD